MFYSVSSVAGVKEPSMLLTSRVNSPFEVANKAFVFGHHLWQDHMACGTLDWGDLFIQGGLYHQTLDWANIDMEQAALKTMARQLKYRNANETKNTKK